jgi:hypothetical protein
MSIRIMTSNFLDYADLVIQLSASWVNERKRMINGCQLFKLWKMKALENTTND